MFVRLLFSTHPVLAVVVGCLGGLKTCLLVRLLLSSLLSDNLCFLPGSSCTTSMYLKEEEASFTPTKKTDLICFGHN